MPKESTGFSHGYAPLSAMYSLIVACVAYKVHPDRICYKQEIWRRESVDTVTAVRNRILALCGEREITINKLATISALPPSSIKNILYGKSQNPKLITIKMICDGLGITLGEFFSTPEFDGLEQEII